MSDNSHISPRNIELLHEKFTTEEEFDKAYRRLLNHEPLQYILGEWYFYDEVYKVSPDCLIPRPETEHLVEEAIRTLPQGALFADLCTGSGCIAISILAHRPDCRAIAVDISEKALSIAKENAKINGVFERIEFVRADLFTDDPLLNKQVDAIVSNPPYIKTDIIPTLQKEVLCEPAIALDGGKDGLDFYRLIMKKYYPCIKTGGYLICEIGYDQGDILKELFGFSVIKDYSGNDRVIILRSK